jgi:oxidase EvaA
MSYFLGSLIFSMVLSISCFFFEEQSGERDIEIDGILHFLIQAKIEPGNINIVQLSPTVQSTKSNFTKVHKGESTPFVEYFLEGKSKILVDQLQSEQGSRFFRKRNRNIIIEIDEEIEHENYRWVSLGDLVAMTKYPNTVNMDSRTVLSCIHFGSYSFEHIELRDFIGGSSTDPSWLDSLLRRDIYQHSHPEILSMITDSRFRREFTSKKIYLSETNVWKLKDGIITRDDEKYFDVVGYRIFIENRESAVWDQPMIQPKSHGICCFFAKKFNGVFRSRFDFSLSQFLGQVNGPSVEFRFSEDWRFEKGSIRYSRSGIRVKNQSQDRKSVV